MSPAAVDIQSPGISNSSSLQSPNHNPNYDHQETIKPPIFGDASEFYDSNGLASRNGLLRAGRTRPRMVKVRKQLHHGKLKAISGEFGLGGFNPFQLAAETDCSSSKNGIAVEKCELKNMSSAFGAKSSSSSSSGSSNTSSSVSILDSGERMFYLNVEPLSSKVESATPESMGFVFEDEKTKHFNENEGQVVSKSDNEELDSSGFVFGSKEWHKIINEDKEVSKAENSILDNVGFVFGASHNNVEIQPELEKTESRECGLNSGFQYLGGVSLEAEVKHGKDNFVRFEFEAAESNSGSNFNFEKGDSSGNAAIPDSNNVGFIFGASDNNYCTNICDANFIFGASCFNSNDKKESGGSLQSLGSTETGKMKVEGQTAHGVISAALKSDLNGTGCWMKDKDKVPHVLGNSSKKSSGSGECMATNFPDEMKSSSRIFESCNSMAGAQNGTLDSDIDLKCKLPLFQNISNIANVFGTNPLMNLYDEIKKLNIDGFKNVDEAVNTEASANDDPLFVFRSNKMAEATSNGSSASTYEQNLDGLAGAAKGNFGKQFESTDKTGRSNVGSTTIGISSSESFTFQQEHAVGSAKGHLSHGQLINGPELNGAAASSSFSLFNLESQGKENNESSSDGLGVPFTDFTTPKWDPSCLKASLFPELNKKLEFSVKGGSKKDKKSKTMRRKLKQLSQYKQHQEQDHLENKNSPQEATNSPGCYSPMDFSPYEETAATEIFSRETTMTSKDSIHLDNNCASSALHSTVAGGLKDGEILDLDKGDETNTENFVYHSEKCFAGDSPAKVFGFEMPCSDHNAEQVPSSSGAGVVYAENAFAFNTGSSRQMQFGFASGLEDIDGRKFAFSASSATPKSIYAAKRVHRKKSRRKVASEPFLVAANSNVKDQEGDLRTQRKFGNDSEENDQVKQGSASSTVAIQEACETWRLRGNHAYKNGDLLKAEDSYTRGINSVPSSEISGCCLKPLVICYSNRAATRMSLGNMREALKDCATAAVLDPRFLKVQMRAANCHLALGEVEKAYNYFSTCLEFGAGVCLDRRITVEAADGLQKCQKVVEYINQCDKLLDRRTSDAARNALDIIADALSISPYSERLLEMKAEFMFMLQRYEEMIQLCEQTLHAAEKNFASSGIEDQLVVRDGSQNECHSFARLWRWRLISKSYFYLGRLEVALDFLEKLERIGSTSDKNANKILESSVSLAVTIRALVNYKSAGNEAVRSGRYTEALEHYTAAISSNIESRPFAAICFCNRAAAHQALSQIADAIADCSLATALDGIYSKAVARRATLHEMIRDFGQAASDLQRLISVLENTSDGKGRQFATPSKSISSTKELRQAHRRLSLMEEEAKKGIPLDLYLILGVKQSDSAADIKKAYRKAALRHHPDKAGQFLARSESGEEGRLWKDIVQEVHMDADRLFKMIGEAYAVLSDPTKRSEYDLDEEIRKASKEYNGNHPPRRPSSDYHSYSYGRNDHRRNWQDTWRTYGHSRSRW
ncbi:uncharacterized protein LOC8268658 [Ricinus communis]|uniref:uncharacterized protein LOC8268658 n=1 Tax=Ricinus communis TaxID=3988 RepID=UPI00201AA130|nr:uncharacterized protein LOC8268658 [Ricinus communis]